MTDEPLLRAEPNPVPYGDTPGTTEIAWSAGAAENAVVMVSIDGGKAKPFAAGHDGVARADWIAPGHTYRFILRVAPEGKRAARIDVAMAEPPRIEPPAPAGKPFLVASPNPVPHHPELGTTVLSWSTGGRGIGLLTVIVGGQETPVASGADAVTEATWIKPATMYVFRLYADLERSRRLASVTVMMASPIRERAMDIAVLGVAAGVVATAVAVPLSIAVRIARRLRR